MEDNGEGRKIEVSPVSSKLRWDTILAFITSSDDDAFFKRITEEKEKRRIENNKDEDYEDKQILNFKKMGLSSLKGVQCFVQREMERVMMNEADGQGVFPLNTPIPKKKRTLPREEEELDYIRKTTIQCLQGSSSTSVKYQVEQEHRILQGRQQLENDQLNKQTANKFKRRRQVPAPAPSPSPSPEPKSKNGRRGFQAAKLPPVPQSIPGNIKEEIDRVHGTNITWLSEKALPKSDIDKGLNRLFLPSDCYDLLGSIMTDDEKNTYVVLDKNDKGLKTRLIDPNRNTWDMDFKYWPSLSKNVFTGPNWKLLVASFALVPGDKVQIWCFREPVGPDMKLCFAINIVRSPAEAAPAPAPATEPEMDEM